VTIDGRRVLSARTIGHRVHIWCTCVRRSIPSMTAGVAIEDLTDIDRLTADGVVILGYD
jgi:hypothetical protein